MPHTIKSWLKSLVLCRRQIKSFLVCQCVSCESHACSLLIGRSGLWPIRRFVCRASTRPAENAASSASPARASSNRAEPHRRSALPASTVSNTKNSCMQCHVQTHKLQFTIMQKYTKAHVCSWTSMNGPCWPHALMQRQRHTSCLVISSGFDDRCWWFNATATFPLWAVSSSDKSSTVMSLPWVTHGSNGSFLLFWTFWVAGL